METPRQLTNELKDWYFNIVQTYREFKRCPRAWRTPSFAESELQTIQEQWKEFRRTHTRLFQSLTEEQREVMPYFTQNRYQYCKELVMQMRAETKEIIRLSKEPLTPLIQLPMFSGSYEDWPNYKNMFLSRIHRNDELNNVQKFHYLNSSVFGEPKALLRQIKFDIGNYDQAWETLEKRYNNKRLNATSLLKRILNKRKNNCQSSKHIKSLLELTTECLNSLKALEIHIDNWDTFIILLVVQKFDTKTHREWEEYASQKHGDELPKMDTFTGFLDTMFRTLELIEQPSSSSSQDEPVR